MKALRVHQYGSSEALAYEGAEVGTQYLAKREEAVSMSNELFKVIASGAVNVRIHGTLPLSQAKATHELFQTRSVAGAAIPAPTICTDFQLDLET